MKRSICYLLLLLVVLPISAKEQKKIVSDKRLDQPITDNKWLDVQKKAKDTVVQLFIQTAEFNWKEPFKSPEQSRAWGSGFFINSDGYLVSNYHVVDEAVKVRIQIPSLGKEQFLVEVVGASPDRDITLLRLTKKAKQDILEKLKEIPSLPLGDSDTVLRTHEVLALGYPLGQQKLKSTQGIVSGRENLRDESYIQITAAINDGNSGGPSLNKDGEVIGINTAGFSRAQNVGYIIPINDVKSVIDDLHDTKLLHKPFLGGEYNIANKELVSFLKNPSPGGLYVSRVYKNTLLDKAGLQAGDMIYAINGNKFDLYGETSTLWSEDRVPLAALLNRFKLGQKINISYARQGQHKETTFTFDVLKQLPIRYFYPEFEKIDYEIIGGMVLMQLTLNHVQLFEEHRSFLTKYKKREHQYEPRLLLTHIFNGSETQKARVFKEVDLIEEVNGKKVQTLEQFRNAVKQDERFLRVKNKDKKLMVLDLAKVVEQEDELIEEYFYKKSAFVKDLEKKLTKKE